MGESQVRTVSVWGKEAQASLARLRILAVGVGSVGLDVALRLTATGIKQIGVMDFDSVELINRDRMIGATKTDARLRRAKTDVAARLATRAATARQFEVTPHEQSICEPAGLAAALDYDLIISCVDSPWARVWAVTCTDRRLGHPRRLGPGLDSAQAPHSVCIRRADAYASGLGTTD
ncbi:MAG: ThiF family adenylyltransferase [Streptosporangiaceae bacterium]